MFLEPVFCECGRQAEVATGADVYPHRPDLGYKRFYVCHVCDARVGCHTKSGKPLGTLATAPVREARSRAHKAFDPLWQNKTAGKSRTEWYAELRRHMGLSKDLCHIGKFDIAQCAEVENFVRLTTNEPEYRSGNKVL